MFTVDALKALVVTETGEVYLDRICPDRELGAKLLEEGVEG